MSSRKISKSLGYNASWLGRIKVTNPVRYRFMRMCGDWEKGYIAWSTYIQKLEDKFLHEIPNLTIKQMGTICSQIGIPMTGKQLYELRRKIDTYGIRNYNRVKTVRSILRKL